ncbi:MAG: SRPBCC domain-containing protein [Nocardioides sp.]|uniref:SRPBCC family protein n=1 Tax=Nocardioides sp. TaxID=35761 RepID=UPI003266C8EF
MTESDQPERVEHRAEHSVELSATPEQVWAAIATADGISAWMVPTRLDPQIGGAVSFDHGGLRSTGVITAYTPNQRLAYEEPWPMTEEMREWAADTAGHEVTDEELELISPIATEFLIEAASGGSCILRVVSSSYGSGADWENEYFADMVAGWGEVPFGPDEQTPWFGNLTSYLIAANAKEGIPQ